MKHIFTVTTTTLCIKCHRYFEVNQPWFQTGLRWAAAVRYCPFCGKSVTGFTEQDMKAEGYERVEGKEQ